VIESSIPLSILLFKDNESDVRSTAGSSLGKLAEQGVPKQGTQAKY
jgi:hypothetical protein